MTLFLYIDWEYEPSKKLYQDFLYDPNGNTTIRDCKDPKESKCKDWWGPQRRSQDIAFNERKMLRLAFHDCFLYEDGSGGCDGCLNLDENLDGNDGLQFSVAVLEKLYTDPDFPSSKDFKDLKEFPNEPKLEASPQKLGISRADLWAFAGLVALDEVQQRTKKLCLMDEHGYTCEQNQCYSPFNQAQFESMFETGRSDCVPKDANNPKQGYLASQEEVHPNQHGNGQDTVAYFKSNFGLGPRESLALMGVHTVGKFNPMTAHNDYAWVRDREERMELFNNEYYQMMSLKPSKIKSYCTGTMNDKPAKAEFQVSAHVFRALWPGQVPYAGEGNPGFLSWRVEYIRGPTCDAKLNDDGIPDDEDFQLKDKEEFWHKEDWETCCKAKANGENPEGCERSTNGRARLTSSEVGYYLDFKFDSTTGLPYGCGIFDDFEPFQRLDPNREEDQEELSKIGQVGNVVRPEDFKTLKKLSGVDGVARSMCKKQKKIKDEKNGKPIWKTVEMFAENGKLEVWHKEFLKAYHKMSINNNANLVKTEGFFMAHGCKCFQNQVDFWGEAKKNTKVGRTKKVDSPMECLAKCEQESGCNEFLFNPGNRKCEMYRELKMESKEGRDSAMMKNSASRFMVHGKMDQCTEETLKDCKAFQ